jgi:hypothetical protein
LSILENRLVRLSFGGDQRPESRDQKREARENKSKILRRLIN